MGRLCPVIIVAFVSWFVACFAFSEGLLHQHALPRFSWSCFLAAFVCLLLPPIDALTVNLQVLYINPTGANPTGTLLSVERRNEIYQLCCDYNLLLLEDDPYYYLQFGDKDTRPPSFLSLDTQGRVLRSPLFIF